MLSTRGEIFHYILSSGVKHGLLSCPCSCVNSHQCSIFYTPPLPLSSQGTEILHLLTALADEACFGEEDDMLKAFPSNESGSSTSKSRNYKNPESRLGRYHQASNSPIQHTGNQVNKCCGLGAKLTYYFAEKGFLRFCSVPMG